MVLVAAALTLAGCSIIPEIHPPSYEPDDADGNACRNQCIEQYYACIDLYAADENATETCSRGMKSGLDLEHCYKQCVEHHGGEVTPYREEKPETTRGQSGDECESDTECGRRLSCEDGECQ